MDNQECMDRNVFFIASEEDRMKQLISIVFLNSLLMKEWFREKEIKTL